MALLTEGINPKNFRNKYIFLDNDFLGIIFSSEEILRQSIKVLTGYRTIDPFTKFEFLRDVFLPEIRDKKEEFISNPIFSPVIEHQEIFKKINNNALILSRLYSHQGKSGASLVDLLLAANLMLYREAILVTGNKKDFPDFIFDLVGVMNFEEKSGNIKAISIVKFNSTKFQTCEISYKKIKGR